MLKLLVLTVFVGLFQQAVFSPSFDLSLVKSLEANGRVNVVVTLKERTSSVLGQFSLKTYETRTDRLNAVATSLQAFAAKSQARVLRALEQEKLHNHGFTFKSLWLTNQILIRKADLGLVEKLSDFEEVDTITEEIVINLEEPLDLTIYDNLPKADDEEFQWGVEQIEAPVVWNGGNRGDGIVVATIDTGVRYTHEALRNNFRAKYGWLDPWYFTPEPNDQNGHGTHTTANIAGKARHVGVAPNTTWIACKGCATSSCFQLDLLDCAQWIACPTDTDGNNPDCSLAPHLVSNSWGGGRGSTWYAASVNAWRAAGIIPVFSIGNSGPACNTANSPGDYENVIGVGATSSENILAYFSSVGPTYNGQRIKPDVAAPGQQVFSAYHTSDTAYATLSGTSMACPHAAGTIALMLASTPNADVNYDKIKEALQAGSVQTVSEGKSCEGIPDTKIPNHHIGHGRINARQSVVRYRELL
ncbi:unnamed protein product [Allacma fusca]|uniref:Peptidase S8/S53 domain-containing protein n=1 Tax=Allacma fusca TaxID=39272 RepID=A0A8J2MC13_9HEXA|nr:unnamed protein product [Allacma fusca]